MICEAEKLLLRGSANDDLVAKTRYFVFNSQYMGSQCSCLKITAQSDLRMSLPAEFCDCRSGLLTVCG